MTNYIFTLILAAIGLGMSAPAAAECGNQFEIPFHKIAPSGESYEFTVDPECSLVTAQAFVNKGTNTWIATNGDLDLTLDGPTPSSCSQSAPLELCHVTNPEPGTYVLYVDRVKGRPSVRIAAGTQ